MLWEIKACQEFFSLQIVKVISSIILHICKLE